MSQPPTIDEFNPDALDLPAPKAPEPTWAVPGDWQKLDACIHCGMCLPVCPTYEVTGSEAESPRGRLYLMKAWADGEITAPQLERHLEGCLGCLACQTACPSGVQYGQLLFASRAALGKVSPPSKRAKLKRWLRRQVLAKVLTNRLWLNVGRGLIRQVQFRNGFTALTKSPLARWIKPMGWYANLVPDRKSVV